VQNFIRVGLSLISGLLLLSQKAPACPEFFHTQIPNAEVPAEDYRHRMMARDLTEINSMLEQMKTQHPGTIAQSIQKYQEGLVPGAKLVDIGGGLSVYGARWAQLGVDVTVINAQNMLSLLDRFANAEFLEEYIREYGGSPYQGPRIALRHNLALSDVFASFKLEPIRGSTLQKFAAFMGRTPSEDFKYYGFNMAGTVNDPAPLRQEAASIVLEYRAEIQRLQTAGKFNYEVGLAQTVLAKIPPASKDRLFEMNGGYYYSPDKIEVLDLSLATLKPGGMGVFLFDNEYAGISQESFSQLGLSTYLARTWPEIFQSATVVQTGLFGETMSLHALIFHKPLNGQVPVFARQIRMKPDVSWKSGDIPISEFERY
jgi:hypothetical protein